MTVPGIILTTWQNVLIIAPQLNTVGPPDLTNLSVQQLFLQDAANLFQASKYGGFTEEIQRYATAHKAAMALDDAKGTGPIQNETIGGISISYTPVAARALQPWTETQFGRRVLQLIKMTMTGAQVIGPSMAPLPVNSQ